MNKSRVLAAAIACLFPLISHATILDFHFTGNILVANPDPSTDIIYNGNDPISGIPNALTPISATLSYDTVNGIGSSNLSITMPDFMGSPATFHDITMQNLGGNQIDGQILVDWAGNFNMPLHINWDATGLISAIGIGLNVGDTISGTTLQQDTNGDGSFDTFTDVMSGLPYSDYLLSVSPYATDYINAGVAPEGPAPLAATNSSLGLGYDINGNYIGGTPFDGIRGLINIGSGNSITVTAITNVPLPAAAWLFVSGALCLAGISRRKKAA